MIADREFKNYEDIYYFEEPETIKKEVVMDQIYEILEQEHIIYPKTIQLIAESKIRIKGRKTIIL